MKILPMRLTSKSSKKGPTSLRKPRELGKTSANDCCSVIRVACGQEFLRGLGLGCISFPIGGALKYVLQSSILVYYLSVSPFPWRPSVASGHSKQSTKVPRECRNAHRYQ